MARPSRRSCLLAGGALLLLLAAAPLPAATPPSPMPPADTTRTPDGFDLQGHRGARGLAPENTIPAFRRALELGVTTLEMDVAVAGDGTVVVSHEPWMNPTICRAPDGREIEDGRVHNLYEMAYDDIARYDCGRLRHPDFPEQTPQAAPKPRLRDVIGAAETYVTEHDRPPVFYNIEIKSRPEWDGQFHPPPDAFVERVLSVVTDGGVASRTTIQSFDPRALEAVHEQNRTVRIALLVSWAGTEGLSGDLERLSFTPDVYSPHGGLVDAEVVAAVQERGLTLVPWTINDKDDMRRLIALGVDGLITDYPDRARAVLTNARP